MQVLAADTDIAEGSLAVPDAVGERAQPGKGDGEGQPAEQRGPLPWAELIVVCAADRAGRRRGIGHNAHLTHGRWRRVIASNLYDPCVIVAHRQVAHADSRGSCGVPRW